MVVDRPSFHLCICAHSKGGLATTEKVEEKREEAKSITLAKRKNYLLRLPKGRKWLPFEGYGRTVKK